MRAAVARALELARGGTDRFVLELPTGYGKTSAGPLVFRAFREAGLCWKAIHVFPLRAVLHKTLKEYVSKYSDISFTYQDGDVTLTEQGYVKSADFSIGDYVLTTVDSFIHNLFKAPVSELHRIAGRSRAIHYHVPFANIYPSCVFFDEAHISALEESGKASAALEVAVSVLAEAHVPVVVMSATMGAWKKKLFRGFKFVQLGSRDREDSDTIYVHDTEFERCVSKIRYTVRKINLENVAEIAKRKVKEGKRVLIVYNNLGEAANLAKKLGGVLIHSRLTRTDRQKAENELAKADVVVGTSAIEAGVDVSFDVLISSADAPESVIQRVGRVCRKVDCNECQGEIYIFGEQADMFLPIKQWRLPYMEGSYISLLRSEINRDAGIAWLLGELSKFIYIPPDVLKKVFIKAGMSYVRSALVEACADESCKPESAFPVSLDKANELPIDKIYINGTFEKPPKEYNISWLVSAVEKYGDFPKLVLKCYVEGLGPFC